MHVFSVTLLPFRGFYAIGQMTPIEAYIVSLALGIGMKVVCFIIGYLIVHLGYKLLKLNVTGQFQFSGEWSKFKIGLASVSPGLLFVLLGSAVIAFGMFVEKEVKLEQKPFLSLDTEKWPKPPKKFPFSEEALKEEDANETKDSDSP